MGLSVVARAGISGIESCFERVGFEVLERMAGRVEVV